MSESTPDSEAPTASTNDARTLGAQRPRARADDDLRESQPTSIGRFAIVRTLGAGGMGFVYVGRDESLRRDVAIKVLRSERNSVRNRQRLEREAHALAQLSHPNVVPVFEVGDHDGRLFIAMELVDGDSLRTWLRNEPRTWREIVDVFLQAAEGLGAAHARGLVHRDFKPENALLGVDGRVRVVDFGVVAEGDAAHATDAGEPVDENDDALRTQTGEFLGTPRYMAPEQFLGVRVGPQADQFAWCVAVYEALSRERPYPGASISDLASAVTGGAALPLPAGEYPRAIADVLARGLSRDPNDRFVDMHALVAAVRAAIAPQRRTWPFVAAAVVVGTAVGIAIAVGNAKPPAAPAAPAAQAEPAIEPARLEGPPSDLQTRAQDSFAAGHAALERGDPGAAVRAFDAAAAPFERAQDRGEDIARIELDRALAYVAAWMLDHDPQKLVIGHELLRRSAANEYQHPHPAELQARANKTLEQLAAHDAALAKARGTDDATRRFYLLYFDQHPPGTTIETPDGRLCDEPCTVALEVDDAALMRLWHPGYVDILMMARPYDHLSWQMPISGMRRLQPGETYAPVPFP